MLLGVSSQRIYIILRVKIYRHCSTALTDPCGRSPLHLAAQHGLGEVTTALLNARADPGASLPGTKAGAIHLAASGGHTGVLVLLLEAGVGLESEDSQGHTPLMLAAVQGHLEATRLLVESGARLDAQDQMGRTALLLHCSSPCPNPAIVSLLSSHLTVNLPCWQGCSPLPSLLAQSRPALPALLALVKAGADLSSPPPPAVSPLHKAIESRDEAGAGLLIRAGATALLEPARDGIPLLLAALQGGNLHLATLMLMAGAHLPPHNLTLGPEAATWVRENLRKVWSLRALARTALRRALRDQVWRWVPTASLPHQLANYVTLLLE